MMDAFFGGLIGLSIGVVLGASVQASNWAGKAKNRTVMQYRGKRYCVMLEDEFLSLRRARREYLASTAQRYG